MSQIEQLHSTRLRVARETSVGNGAAAHFFLPLQVTAAAVTRNLVQTAERRDVYRQLSGREMVSQSWELMTGHEIGTSFFRYLLTEHLQPRGAGRYTLDPEATGGTFVIEAKTENGNLSAYTGCAVQEIRIIFESRKVMRMEVTWLALKRTVLEVDLAFGEAADWPEQNDTLIPTRTAGFAATIADWQPQAREANGAVMVGAQLYLKREIQATNYGPDGQAGGFTRAPWSLLGEVYLPETPSITEAAFAEEWRGRMAFWFGPNIDHVRINQAVGFVNDENLKDFDFRIRRIAIEGTSDIIRSLADFYFLEPALVDTNGDWIADTDEAIIIDTDMEAIYADANGLPPPPPPSGNLILNDDGTPLLNDDANPLQNDP